jgi:hypothetical protein
MSAPTIMARTLTAEEQRSFDDVERCIEGLVSHQEQKVVAFARRLRPGLTGDDIKNPHDYDELNDPDFNYEDGLLAGLQTALSAVRRRRRDIEESE